MIASKCVCLEIDISMLGVSCSMWVIKLTDLPPHTAMALFPSHSFSSMWPLPPFFNWLHSLYHFPLTPLCQDSPENAWVFPVDVCFHNCKMKHQWHKKPIFLLVSCYQFAIACLSAVTALLVGIVKCCPCGLVKEAIAGSGYGLHILEALMCVPHGKT